MMEHQKFRFCCGCQRLTLVNLDKQSCYFCNSTFIVQGTKSDLHDMNIKEYYKRQEKNKLKKLNQI